MADHVWGIGGGAEMMIRDHGIANGHIEFWFHAGSSTWNNQQDWGYDAGWGYIGRVFKLNTGGGWHHLETIHIPTSRNVMMRMVGEGLGWPTSDRTAYISRATVPPAPYMHWAQAISTSQARVRFDGQGDGGSPIREWQIGYGTDPWNPQYFVGADGDDIIGGLSQTWWYFWARGRNDLGWSGWSGRAQTHIWRVPDPPSAVAISELTQRSLRTQFGGGFDGGTGHIEFQLAYSLGTDVNLATHIQANSGISNLSNLDPGKTYYFWARGRNQVGWGPYSAVRAGTLRAGAMVKDAGVWKRALPYEKVNGIWRLLKPTVKHAGVWKETS